MRIPPRALFLLGLVLLAGCQAARPARYLYVWAGTGHPSPPHRPGTDFIAILDANPASPSYGRILATAPVSQSGMMPHHAEYALPASRPFFANDFMSGQSFVIDPSRATAPRVVTSVAPTPGFRQLHSFVRVADTLVFATLQFGDSTLPGNPGGLAEFTASGQLLRTASSGDSSFPGAPIRTYGLTVLPAIDRALSTSSPMDTERTANVVQVWRLSDLTLLKTIQMPGIAGDSVE